MKIPVKERPERVDLSHQPKSLMSHCIAEGQASMVQYTVMLHQ